MTQETTPAIIVSNVLSPTVYKMIEEMCMRYCTAPNSNTTETQVVFAAGIQHALSILRNNFTAGVR